MASLSHDDNDNKYHILFLGDGGVGKTTFIQKHNSGEFSVGVEMKSIHCHMDQMYGVVHGVVVMFDLTSLYSYNNINFWLDKCPPGIPIVLVGNKIDIVEDRHIIHRPLNIQYFDISAKTGHNFNSPLLYLIRKITGKLNAGE
jgi:GTP-binding nuclear protein Ran